MSPQPSDVILERLTRLHPKKIDLTLGRTLDLLERLGRPQDRLPPVVHVAGTNGKGSLVAFMAAILTVAGYRVHTYTSPHLVRFNERIRLHGVPIDEDRLGRFLDFCERRNEGRPITFFEITTCAALCAFADVPADAVVLETGLGGTFDTTNVVDRPAATVITPISIDHVRYLGGTLAEIAANKAGILKPGVPAIVGPQPPEALAVIEARAHALDAPLFRHGIEWDVAPTVAGMRVRMGATQFDLPKPGLLGRHQIDNAATAVVTAGRLAAFDLPDSAIAEGVRTAQWAGRLQRIVRGPLVKLLPTDWDLWIDGGHNPGAAAVLADVARDWDDRPLHLVVGMLDTRPPEEFLRPLATHAASLTAVPVPGTEHGHPAAVVAAAARSLGMATRTADTPSAAVKATAADAPAPSRILVCGSLYLVGSVLAENG